MATLLSYALCSVSDVKETLGIGAGDLTKDNLIVRKINQATEMIEGYCQRRFLLTTYADEEYRGWGYDQLVLRNRPIVSFTSLSARNNATNDNSWTAVPATDYFIDNNAGLVNALGPFYGGWNRWKVTYSAGYATIPADVAEACVTLAAFLTDNATAGSGSNVKRKREGQREIEYQNQNQQEERSTISQLGLDDILDRYSSWTISGQR